ncbi:MAG: peptidoglycan DD-metalloendopeptidase family protein [Rhodocyclaceae bacterium]|nr:peptidoglycan DD-metalloendopeptidase family protein [Rhodocyclaceae bacterium]
MSQPPVPTEDRASLSASAAAAQSQPSGPGYYTVKRGDSLYRIAIANGRDPKDIAAWNNLSDANAIKEGQVLRVAPPGVPEQNAGVVTNPVIEKPLVESRPLDAAPQAMVAGVGEHGSTNAVREPRGGKEPYSDEAYARLNKLDAPKPVEPIPDVPAAAVAPGVAPVSPDGVVWAWPSSGKVAGTYSEAGNKGLDIAGKLGDPVLAAADGKVVYAGAGLRGYGELVIVKHNATYLSAYAHNRKILVKEKDMVTKGQKIAEMGNSDSDSVKLHFEIRKQGKPIDPMPYLPKR